MASTRCTAESAFVCCQPIIYGYGLAQSLKRLPPALSKVAAAGNECVLPVDLLLLLLSAAVLLEGAQMPGMLV